MPRRSQHNSVLYMPSCYLRTAVFHAGMGGSRRTSADWPLAPRTSSVECCCSRPFFTHLRRRLWHQDHLKDRDRLPPHEALCIHKHAWDSGRDVCYKRDPPARSPNPPSSPPPPPASPPSHTELQLVAVPSGFAEALLSSSGSRPSGIISALDSPHPLFSSLLSAPPPYLTPLCPPPLP